MWAEVDANRAVRAEKGRYARKQGGMSRKWKTFELVSMSLGRPVFDIVA